jgi:hypothetical protein
MAVKARPKAITKLSQTDSFGKKNWLIFADSGSGKTVLCGTAPKALFLTVEAAGTESAKEMGSDADEWVTDTAEELDAAYEYFKNGTGCQDYEWVLIDSLSEVEDVMWARLQNGGTAKKIQDYGTIATEMKRFVDKWNRLPVNVIYTAQAQRFATEDQDTEEDLTIVAPMIGTQNGVLSQKIAGKVTLVGFLTVRKRADAEGKTEEYRRLQLRGNARVTAKDRHMIAPKSGFLRNPTIPDMLDRVGNGYKGQPKSVDVEATTDEGNTDGE